MNTSTPLASTARSPRAASRAQRKAPVRLVSMTRRQSASSMSTRVRWDSTPALATRRSTGAPSSSRARENAATTESSSVTSSGVVMARPPAAVTPSAISRALSSLSRWSITTAAPCAASSKVVVRPMPPVAPVTRATRPCSSRASSGWRWKPSRSMGARYPATSMAHFESDAEVYDQLGGILNNLVHNSARREQLRQADAVVQFAFRAPDATVTFDVRAGKRVRLDLGETKLRPDVVLAMDADTGRALLTGELSPTVALARGDVRTKGPVSKVLRLVPATVGAHEVEADLEPEPEPVPQPQAVAAAPAGGAPAGGGAGGRAGRGCRAHGGARRRGRGRRGGAHARGRSGGRGSGR